MSTKEKERRKRAQKRKEQLQGRIAIAFGIFIVGLFGMHLSIIDNIVLEINVPGFIIGMLISGFILYIGIDGIESQMNKIR